jgi:hypothetical protein
MMEMARKIKRAERTESLRKIGILIRLRASWDRI